MRVGKRERANLADSKLRERVRQAKIARAGTDPGFRLFNQSKIIGKTCRTWDWSAKYNAKVRRLNQM